MITRTILVKLRIAREPVVSDMDRRRAGAAPVYSQPTRRKRQNISPPVLAITASANG
jgi:hypothetical protein